MRTPKALASLISLVLLALMLGACGSPPATLATLPVYPDAVELKPGESTMADTLANNTQQDQAMRQAAGVGGATEQKGFHLPDDTTWEQVQAFYGEKLKAAGWKDGIGGPGASMAAQAMQQVNQGNEMFQTTMYSKGKQILSVIRMADPTNPSKAELILSLSSN